jgi:hypothetical protein
MEGMPMAELTAAELEALVARRRVAMGIGPADPVEEELAKTTDADQTSILQQRIERAVRARPRAPSLKRPAKPELSVIDLIHRGHGGYVAFASKASGTWADLGCVRADLLRGLFGSDLLERELDVDSYFGLHGIFATGYHRPSSTLPQLAPTLRKAEHVRWLTTMHVDLDTYNVGMDAEDGVAAVLRAAREGIIPPPSMFSLAHGCWAWWLLRDEHSKGPVRAWPETVDRWASVQGRLHQRLASLGSDPAQIHRAVFSRVPGSMHSKTKRRVAWLGCFDDDLQPFVYTLEEMANAVGIEHAPLVIEQDQPVDDRPKDPSRIERGKRGYHGRWQRYMAVLDQLRRMRGGWRVGTRTKALWLVAQGCRARGWDTKRSLAEMTRHLDGMAQPSNDQLRPAVLRGILKGVGKPKAGGVRWQTVADLLDVSPEESVVISTARSRIPPARRHDQLPDLKPVPPAERQRRRQDTLKRLLAELADYAIPPARILREMLVAEGHDPASDRTLHKDLVAIGRPSPRRHKPRRPAPGTPLLEAPNGRPDRIEPT